VLRDQIVNLMDQAAIIRDLGPDHDRVLIEPVRRVIFGGGVSSVERRKIPGLLSAWEKKIAAVCEARKKIADLRTNGRGMDLDGSRGTFWGVLNVEFVDHHRKVEGPRISYALFGMAWTSR
jgi:hypothetical protein